MKHSQSTSTYLTWKQEPGAQELLAENKIPDIIAERIFEAGRLAERNNVLELILSGALTVTSRE